MTPADPVPASRSSMKLSRRTLLSAAATVAGAAVVSSRASAGAVAAPSSAPPARTGSARLLIPTAIDHLDPTTNTYAGGFLIALLHGQLFKWARPEHHPGELVPEPYMARSIEQPDDTTVVIRLRKGIRFHDREPVNGRLVAIQDIAATFARIKDPAVDSPRRRSFGPVHVPVKVDDRTMQFSFDHPYAPFFSDIADVWQSILPYEVIELGSDALKQNTIGCGPFQMHDPQGTVEIQLEAHPVPWWEPWERREPAPHLAGINFAIIPDDIEKQTRAFLGGQLDYSPIARDSFEAVEADARFESQRFASQDFNYMRTSAMPESTVDVRIRQALSLGINRAVVARTAFGPGGARRTGPIPASRVPWGQPVGEVPFHGYRPVQARQLLAAAGFGDGIELVNLALEDDFEQNVYAAEFTRQLRAVGIHITHDRYDRPDYLERARLARTDPEGAGWHINMHTGNRYNDPAGYIDEYHTGSMRNLGGWGSADLDQQIEASARMLDRHERVEAIDAINRVVAEQAWTPGLLLPVQMEAWNADLRHVAAGPEWFQGTRSFIDASFEP